MEGASTLSKIDSTGFQGFLEELMDVKGYHINPQQFESGTVYPNVEITQGGFAKGGVGVINSGSALAMVGLHTRLVTGTFAQPFPERRQVRIVNESIQVSFDAAGMTTFDGKIFEVTWYLTGVPNPALRSVVDRYEQVVTDLGEGRNYNFPLRRTGWLNIIPHLSNLNWEVHCLNAGINFPAATFAQRATWSITKAEGAWLPGS